MMRLWRAALDWQSRQVLWRHLRVYMKNWYTGFLPPVAEPIVLLLAFGLGLGAHVSGIGHGDAEVNYASFIAPGMLAYTAFLTPFFQSLYAAFIRMHYQKTWEGQLTTQVQLPHVIWGELFWAALLGTCYVAIVACVIAACNAIGIIDIQLWSLPAAIPMAFIAGIGFAAVGLFFTAILPSIDHMTLPVFLIALPLGFTSNTYFPMPVDNPVVWALMHANPLYHLAECLRSMALGDGPIMKHLLCMLAISLLTVCILLPIIERKLRRRVLGEH